LIVHTERRRSTLRVRVVMAIVAVALAPQLLVFAWSQLDRNVPGRIWGRVRDTAVDALPLARAAELPSSELDDAARTSKTRIRIFGSGDALLFEADHDDPSGPLDPVEQFFLGPVDATSLRQIDDELGPLQARPEVQIARKEGWYVGCEYASIVLCQAIASAPAEEDQSPRLLVVQASSRRAVQAVYGLRGQLLRLSIVTVPLALVLALYTGRRIVRPIERLRRQALAKASAATAGTLESSGRDEVDVLAEAFNALLAALEKKRADNEAFVADLVHELKNPVAAVRAAADMLAEGGADPERAARVARVLLDSSTKLDRVVTQFLELARAEAGLPDEERAEENVATLAEALVGAAGDDGRHPGVTVAFACRDPGATRVRAVAHRLDALVRELLENARSFAGDGGRVDVRVESQGEEVVLTVSDTGPGIGAEDLPRVFSRFFTTRGRARGTGLGLALVQAVAQAHGGSVSVRSSPGQGATFEVRLPRAR
jgi:two-component system sensor histidine kinase ChvG